MNLWYNFGFLPAGTGPGKRRRYSDSMRAGRAGDRIPMGARLSAPFQTGTGEHPASCTMGTGTFRVVKGPRRGVDHPHHLAPSWPVLG